MGIFDGINVVNSNSFNITTGIVKENYNKENPGTIKVEIFLGENGKNVTGWIPVMSPYAGTGFGMYQLPEIGSEVVIGFNMGDRNCPIVLGCLWNKKNTLPEKTAVEKNDVKRFKTKGGYDMEFNETADKAVFTLTTPGKSTIVIDDEKKTISINDEQKKNTIVIEGGDKGSITVKSDKKMSLDVGGKSKVDLDADGIKLSADKITIDAKSKCEIKSGSINIKGNSDVSIQGANMNIKGSSQTKVESSGIATIKGSMVKIN